MARFPTFSAPIGSINGVNQSFSTPVPYEAGTLVVWQNGLSLRSENDDGWVETGPSSFQMKEAPRKGDVLLVFLFPKA